jgi:hypothetical protein
VYNTFFGVFAVNNSIENIKPGHKLNKAIAFAAGLDTGVRCAYDSIMKNLASYEKSTLTMIDMKRGRKPDHHEIGFRTLAAGQRVESLNERIDSVTIGRFMSYRESGSRFPTICLGVTA